MLSVCEAGMTKDLFSFLQMVLYRGAHMQKCQKQKLSGKMQRQQRLEVITPNFANPL